MHKMIKYYHVSAPFHIQNNIRIGERHVLQINFPLVQLLGSGVPIIQRRVIKALANIVLIWPNTIAKEGGVYELSKVILQADPPLPHAIWESAANILSSILQYSTEYFLEVPVAVLVQLLHSGIENTVVGALNALLVLESDDSTSAAAMAESGAIEALLELLRNHQCEETVARLLETLIEQCKKLEKNTIPALSISFRSTNTIPAGKVACSAFFG